MGRSEFFQKTNAYLERVLSFSGFLSPRECLEVIDNALGPYHHALIVGKEGQNPSYNATKRQTLRKFIHPTPGFTWLHQRIREQVLAINQAYYRFTLDIFATPELLRYDPDGHFRRHTDLGEGKISTRKLSVVIPLSDPAGYQGGELVFYPQGQARRQTQGSLIIFPSYLLHEVKPVTQGVRYSLVNWVLGPPFR